MYFWGFQNTIRCIRQRRREQNYTLKEESPRRKMLFRMIGSASWQRLVDTWVYYLVGPCWTLRWFSKQSLTHSSIINKAINKMIQRTSNFFGLSLKAFYEGHSRKEALHECNAIPRPLLFPRKKGI